MTPDAGSYLLIVAIVLLAAAPIVIKPARDEFISARFWIAALFVFGFGARPLFILLHPEKAHPYIASRPYFPQLMAAALTLVLCSLAAFWIGYGVKLGSALARRVPEFERPTSPGRWRLAVVAWFILGLVAYFVFVRSIGGFGNLLAMLYMRAELWEEAEAGYTKALARLVSQAAALGIGYHVYVRKTRWAWPLLIVSSLVTGTMGSRGPVVEQWMIVWLLYALRYPRYRSAKTFGATVLVIVLFAGAYLSVRRATRHGSEGVVASLAQLPRDFADNVMASANEFDCMVAAMDVAGRDIPFREGAGYSDFLTVLLPKSVWSYQPDTLGVQLRKVIEPTSSGGRPPTALGEGYMNYGFIGGILPMFFLGVWCRLIHSYLRRTQGATMTAALLYALALPATLHLAVSSAPMSVRSMIVDWVVILGTYVWAAAPAPSTSEEEGVGQPAEVASG